MPLLASPSGGDVVVRQETRDGTVVFVLRTAHGTDQFLLRTREEAVAQAVTFANRQGVRAWLSGRSGDWLPLGTATEVESVRPGRQRGPRGTPEPVAE
jgi:hypothetical protein